MTTNEFSEVARPAESEASVRVAEMARHLTERAETAEATVRSLVAETADFRRKVTDAVKELVVEDSLLMERAVGFLDTLGLERPTEEVEVDVDVALTVKFNSIRVTVPVDVPWGATVEELVAQVDYDKAEELARRELGTIDMTYEGDTYEVEVDEDSAERTSGW